MSDLQGSFVNASGVTELEGHLHVPGGISADSINGVAVNNTPTGDGMMLATVDANNAAWGTFIIAAGVPVAAPVAGELPIAVDTTAMTGGIYVWDGATWTKAATI